MLAFSSWRAKPITEVLLLKVYNTAPRRTWVWEVLGCFFFFQHIFNQHPPSHGEEYRYYGYRHSRRRRRSPSPICRISNQQAQQYGKTTRGLTSRHIQLMTVGLSIGTGIFPGVGPVLARSGPLSVLLAFTLYPCLGLCPLIICAAEACSWISLSGTFFLFPERYVDPAPGFASGYIYWYWHSTHCLCKTLRTESRHGGLCWSVVTLPEWSPSFNSRTKM
jgi:hypothetical protein